MQFKNYKRFKKDYTIGKSQKQKSETEFWFDKLSLFVFLT